MSDLTSFAQTPAAARIRTAARRRALSHAIILSGAGDHAAAARYIAAAFECVADGERPCLRCPHCRKVMADIHPDVTFVRDDAHRELSADVVRTVRADAFLLPNEGERKVYVLEDCSLWNERGQNILLKTVEEGPPYCAFLFCAENPSALLPTIRSRCVELRLGAADGDADDSGDAFALCRLIAGGDIVARTAFLVRLETGRATRDTLGTLFEHARLLCADALLSLYGAERPNDAALWRLGKQRLARLAALLDTYRGHCAYNVGVGVTLGGFAAELEELLR